MSQRSSKREQLILQLEGLQKNLGDLIDTANNSVLIEDMASPMTEVFNLCSELFLHLDQSGTIQSVNQSTLQILGYPSKELIGLSFVDLIPIIDKKKGREFIYKLNAGFTSISFSTHLVHCTGQPLAFCFQSIQKGNYIYLVGKPFDESNLEGGSQAENYIETDCLAHITNPLATGYQDAPSHPSSTTVVDPPAIMSTTCTDGIITAINATWTSLIGYNNEEAIGRKAFENFDNASQSHLEEVIIPEILASGSAKCPSTMVNKAGQDVAVSLSVSLEYHGNERTLKWLIFSQEIPKEDLEPPAESKGHSSTEGHLKTLINSSKQILFLLDKQMMIMALNKLAEGVVIKHRGFKPAVGQSVLDFLESEDAKGLSEIYKEVLQGRSVHLTREMHLPKKHRRWFEINLFPVEDEHAQINHVVFCAEDITDRKLAEEKLKELENNFKSIFTQVAVGVIISTLKDEVIQANKRFYDLIEYTQEEFEEIQHIGVTHPEDKEKTLQFTEDLINGNSDHYSHEKRYVTKSGRIVWVYFTATVVKNLYGRPKHIISVAQDITLRKTAEQELLYKKSELDTFVYRASHDLRGPVASLMGLYNIVKVEFAHDKNAIAYFEHYNSSVMRLHTVLQNLIDLTKIKESETKLTQVDIKDLIGSCMNTMKSLPDYHRIHFDIAVDFDFKVFVDSKKFKTIIKNLVENSIIYATPESSAFVKVHVTYQENVLKIEVSDNGRGIDPRIQSKVFNMFFRGTEKSKGSGLGLYIVKNAVEKLNGSIQLSSKLNEGTKFSVYIPYLYGQEYSALLEKNFVN